MGATVYSLHKQMPEEEGTFKDGWLLEHFRLFHFKPEGARDHDTTTMGENCRRSFHAGFSAWRHGSFSGTC